MSRTHEDALRWVAQGTTLVDAALASMADTDLQQPSLLPGWTRRHLLAHVAANADALCNLVQWARTGVETPMYASTTQRNDDIEAGAVRPAVELRAWCAASAQRLEQAMGALSRDQWWTEVVTAQGRRVPATEIPWLRAREVMVHATDFGAAVGFDQLPGDFLSALVQDIVFKRRGSGEGPALHLRAVDTGEEWVLPGVGDAVAITGPLPGIAAYLAGRPTTHVTAADGSTVPDLPRWL